jgi:hypothetical protein
MKNATKYPQPAKPYLEDIARLLGAKIIERNFITINGGSASRPSRGELTSVTIKGNSDLWRDILIRNGFRGSYNGGFESPAAFCYIKKFDFCSDWGNSIQVWPNGHVRIVG